MPFQNPYNSLTINGINYSKTDLYAQISSPKRRPEWKKSFYQFLNEWLDDKNFICVKTSGSTGKPKQIQLLKKQMIHSAKMTGNYFKLKRSNTALLCLPCDYIAGKMMVMRAMVLGLNLKLCPPTGNPMAAIHEKIHFAAMIPLQVANTFEQSPQKFKWIEQLIIGGGKVDYILREQLQKVDTQCFATYGMTETITHIAIKKLSGPGQSNYFQALPDVFLSKDDRGCLTIFAPKLADKLVITNDLIDLKNEKQFEWLGRYDNVINTGGIKVFPEKIEAKLEKLIPNRFFISSLPDKKLENKVILIIEDKAWAKEKTDALLADLQQIICKFELPRAVFFIKKFIETPTKKIQRKRTKEKVLKFSL